MKQMYCLIRTCRARGIVLADCESGYRGRVVPVARNGDIFGDDHGSFPGFYDRAIEKLKTECSEKGRIC